jgi:hypothetical protein
MSEKCRYGCAANALAARRPTGEEQARGRQGYDAEDFVMAAPKTGATPYEQMARCFFNSLSALT